MIRWTLFGRSSSEELTANPPARYQNTDIVSMPWKPEGIASMLAPVVHGHRGRTALLAVVTMVVLAGVLLTWNAASSSDAAAAQPTTDATAGQSGETSVAAEVTGSTSTAPATTSTTALSALETTVPAVDATVAVEAVVEPIVEPTTAPTAELAVETPVEVASAGPVPAAAPAPAQAAPANQSGCRTDLARSVMTIEMLDIGYSCPVYAGGQSTIDSGAVTLITDQGSSPLLATHPGDSGTLWIAAHRTSHGAAFAAVPDLADGAIITVSDGGRTASYRVVGRAYVEARNGMVIDASGNPTDAATLDSVLRTDRGGDLARA